MVQLEGRGFQKKWFSPHKIHATYGIAMLFMRHGVPSHNTDIVGPSN